MIITGLIVFKTGPQWMLDKNVGTFLIETLLSSVTIIVPIGAVLLTFLTDYGLIEFCGVFVHKWTRKLFKTSGRSAICIISSFVGSFSLGILMTERMYKDGKFNNKEAAIITTCFSTISVTIMVVVAKTLGIMDIWSTFFWSSFIITCLVSMITVRLWPIRKIEETYFVENRSELGDAEQKLLKAAVKSGLNVTKNSGSIFNNISKGARNGVRMVLEISPTVMSFAFIGIAASRYTKVFDYIGWLFYPIVYLLRIPDPLQVSKAAALSITESIVPTVAVIDSPLISKYIVGVICVSSIIFLAGTIPCILATSIKISFKELIIIWFERVMLTIILSCMVGYIIKL